MHEIDLREFVQKFGKKKAETLLSELGRGQGFIDAIKTNVGKELLCDWVESWRTLFGRIVNDQATAEEKIMFRVIDSKLTEAARKIAKHYDLEAGIKNAISC